MAANKEILKDCRTAVQLEQELQISYAQRGVAILDVYSSEWGTCRAIAETFRRILTDSGDGVHLRFLSVECNSILQSLKSPEEQKNLQRPKNLEAIRDTLPEGWQSILQERCGQSKPFFLFYKEGKRVSQIEGVNTPLIRATVKDLCSVKTPASEFISNPRLQEFWDEQFNPEESDVAYDKFQKGLLASLKYTVPLNDAEKATLGEAVGLNKDRMVTAEGLQKWMGEDELRTVHQAFLDTLPDYEARASAQAAKDLEERKAREAAEAAKKAEDEEEKRRQDQAKKEEEEAEAAQRAKAAEAKHDGGSNIEALLEKLAPEGIDSHAEAADGEAEHNVRKAVGDRAAPATIANRFGAKFVAAEEAETNAAQFNETVTANGKTLKAALREAGVSFKTIAALTEEAVKKVAHEASLTPSARAALLLLSGDETPSSQLIGKPVDFAAAISAQTALTEGGVVADVAFCAISTAVSAAPKDAEFTVSTTSEIVKTLLTTLGGEVALPPLTLLTPDSDSEDRISVTLTGIPMVVELWSAANPGVCCLHWFTKFSISSINPLSGSVTLSYAGLVGEDAFTMKAASLAAESHEDERKYAALDELQKAPQREASKKAAPPAAHSSASQDDADGKKEEDDKKEEDNKKDEDEKKEEDEKKPSPKPSPKEEPVKPSPKPSPKEEPVKPADGDAPPPAEAPPAEAPPAEEEAAPAAAADETDAAPPVDEKTSQGSAPVDGKADES